MNNAIDTYELFLQLLEGGQIEIDPRTSVRRRYYEWLAAAPEQDEKQSENSDHE
jgi:hypothetical protein